MLYRINEETDNDHTASVSVSNGETLAAAINQTRAQNPKSNKFDIPSPDQQQKERSGKVAKIAVDASNGSEATREMNNIMNTNPAIKAGVNNGTMQFVGVRDGVNEAARARMKAELRKFELNENTTMTMDAKSFIEYLKWKNEK